MWRKQRHLEQNYVYFSEYVVQLGQPWKKIPKTKPKWISIGLWQFTFCFIVQNVGYGRNNISNILKFYKLIFFRSVKASRGDKIKEGGGIICWEWHAKGFLKPALTYKLCRKKSLGIPKRRLWATTGKMTNPGEKDENDLRRIEKLVTIIEIPKYFSNLSYSRLP